MTFFGYAVSDMTRSWLLYQGILFVLVMMFMPTGVAGFFQWLGAARRAHGLVPLLPLLVAGLLAGLLLAAGTVLTVRSEEHTSELQSLMRISYAVFCLKKKTNKSHTVKIRI